MGEVPASPFFSRMPLNESAGFRTNLTPRQQREAMQALYGLENTMSPEPLSYEERVKLRRMLDAMDQKEVQGGAKDFDLNKPPVPPYAYREYPYLIYNHAQRVTRPARNPDERARLLEEGWSEQPFTAEQPEIPLTAAEHTEAELVNARLEKKRKP